MERRLTQGLSLQEVETLYFDRDAIRLPGYRLWRAKMGRRYYFDPDDPTAKLYPGVTSVIRAAMPSGYGLERWKIDFAVKHGDVNAPAEYTRERANFGTLLHMLAAEFFSGQQIELDQVQDRYAFHLMQEGTAADAAQLEAERLAPELVRAFLAFLQWTIDFQVKPLFIEALLRSEKHGWASAVDLGCELTVEVPGYWGAHYKTGPRKGEPKEEKKPLRVRAIVDFKSGSGLYEEYDMQGTGYRELVMENWPDFVGGPHTDARGFEVMEALPFFIWRPKDWRTKPSYLFSHRPEHPEWPQVRDLGVSRCQAGEEQRQSIRVSGTVSRSGFDQSALDRLIETGTHAEWLARDREAQSEKP